MNAGPSCVTHYLTARSCPIPLFQFISITILRDPARRAISQLHHFIVKGQGRKNPSKSVFHSQNTFESIAKRVFDKNCMHQSSLCWSLSNPWKCRLGGSCGLFQNHQVNMLAAPHSRAMLQTIELAQNRSVALAAALKIVDEIDVVSRHTSTRTAFHVSICTHPNAPLITLSGRRY